MAYFNTIAFNSRALAAQTANSELKKLAKLVESLALSCANVEKTAVEKTANDAAADAKRARRANLPLPGKEAEKALKAVRDLP